MITPQAIVQSFFNLLLMLQKSGSITTFWMFRIKHVSMGHPGIRYHETTLPQSEENHQISSVAKIGCKTITFHNSACGARFMRAQIPFAAARRISACQAYPVKLWAAEAEEKWRNNCNHPESVGYLFFGTTTDQTNSFSTRQKLKKINEPNKIIHQVREMIQETDSGVMTQINFNLGNGAK